MAFTIQGQEIVCFMGIDWISLRTKKEEKLLQHARVIWMCGLSGAGKTTIAEELEIKLFQRGYMAQILDGDILRSGLNKDLGYSEEERMENLRRVAELSKLFLSCGIISINAFISPTIESRAMARTIVGRNNFIEVYINASIEVCEQRDTKGLYEKARKGMITDFTGINAPFEPPLKPDIEICTDKLTIDDSVNKLINYMIPLIGYKK